MTGKATAPDLEIVPANEASWEELDAVFGTRGDPPRCYCQRFKLQPKESFGSFPAEERAHRLRMQTECGHPRSRTTSGLVAYLGGEPVGWCAVEPRTGYSGLLRVYRTPWDGRDEDKTDDSVWAVTCVLVRAGFRRRGIGYALTKATVEFARQRGARALEAYPMITAPGQEITWGEILVGNRNMFAAAGFAEVHQPSKRRLVMRIDFQEAFVIDEGTEAPDFTLTSDSGEMVALSDLRGSPVVLYFYPRDDTPGCTAQACGIRNVWSEFENRGAVVLGVSPDSVRSHVKFKEKNGLPFTLLADEDHAVAERYGVWVEKSMTGKKYMGIERSTFVIDTEGRIAKVMRKVKPATHSDDVLAALP